MNEGQPIQDKFLKIAKVAVTAAGVVSAAGCAFEKNAPNVQAIDARSRATAEAYRRINEGQENQQEFPDSFIEVSDRQPIEAKPFYEAIIGEEGVTSQYEALDRAFKDLLMDQGGPFKYSDEDAELSKGNWKANAGIKILVVQPDGSILAYTNPRAFIEHNVNRIAPDGSLVVMASETRSQNSNSISNLLGSRLEQVTFIDWTYDETNQGQVSQYQIEDAPQKVKRAFVDINQ